MTSERDPVEPGPLYYKVPRSRVIDQRRGIPRRPILYTEDQVASMLALSVEKLRASYLWRVDHDRGVYRNSFLRAFRMPQNGPEKFAQIEWRVAEGELIRWLQFHDLWIFDPLAETTDLPSTRVHVDLDMARETPVHPNDEHPDPDLLDL